jgi:NAD+ diphosphatase
MRFFDHLRPQPTPELGFAASGPNRAAVHRESAEWQRAAWANPASRFIAICKDTPVLAFDGTRLEALLDLRQVQSLGEAVQTLFLGLEGETPWFGMTIAADQFDALKARTDLKLIDMRSIAMQDLFRPGLTSSIGTTKAMALWHQRHRFCSNCGAASASASSGWKRICAACKSEHFPRTDPVVIMLAIHGDDCLMGRSPAFPEGRYSCLAGFMEPGETIEDAVRREILEETSITTGRVRYLDAQPWPFPGSLMIGCLAEATSREISIDPAELADARWFSRQEVRDILAGSHAGGISAPPRMAIAHHIMQVFAES